VPSTDTTYWWHVTKLPDFNRKHHIIKVRQVILNQKLFVCVLLTRGKTCMTTSFSKEGMFGPIKLVLPPPLLKFLHVPGQERERSCICGFGV